MVNTGDELRPLAGALGERATLGKPLGPLTTYGVGGPAALYVEVEGPDDLAAVRRVCREYARVVRGVAPCGLRAGARLQPVGGRRGVRGDGAAPGCGVRRHRTPGGGGGGRRLRKALVPWCGPAPPWRCPVLARRVADAGWSGLSWAVGVPGSVGGAVRMNAGGHGSDMASCLVRYSWVDLFGDGGGTDPVGHLDYGYRSSAVAASAVGPGGGAVRHAGHGRRRAGGGERHRQMASRAPARRLQRRLGLHQPRGRFGREAH